MGPLSKCTPRPLAGSGGLFPCGCVATHRARHQLQHLRVVQLGLQVCRWRKAMIRDEHSRKHLLAAPRGVHPVACCISLATGNSLISRRLLILAHSFFTGAFRAFEKHISEPWTLRASHIPSYRQAPLDIPAPPSGPQFPCPQGKSLMPGGFHARYSPSTLAKPL